MKVKLYTVTSPDGFSIENNSGYLSQEIALTKFEEWKRRFEAQGYYSSNRGRIDLEHLKTCCEFGTLTLNVYPRKCSCCEKGMIKGYCIRGGEQYFCSKTCLHSKYTEKEWKDLYLNENSDSYFTQWSKEDIDFEDELILKENY